jgi:hypothetical protein
VRNYCNTKLNYCEDKPSFTCAERTNRVDKCPCRHCRNWLSAWRAGYTAGIKTNA